jgi:hypothetical protein
MLSLKYGAMVWKRKQLNSPLVENNRLTVSFLDVL